MALAVLPAARSLRIEAATLAARRHDVRAPSLMARDTVDAQCLALTAPHLGAALEWDSMAPVESSRDETGRQASSRHG